MSIVCIKGGRYLHQVLANATINTDYRVYPFSLRKEMKQLSMDKEI